MAPGRSAAVSTRVAPSADPPRAGLTNSGSPSVATMRSSTAVAPRSWKVSFGSVTEAGVVRPAARTTAFATGFSEAERQGSGRPPPDRPPPQGRPFLVQPPPPQGPGVGGDTPLGGAA